MVSVIAPDGTLVFHYPPTVLAGVQADNRMVGEEILKPLRWRIGRTAPSRIGLIDP